MSTHWLRKYHADAKERILAAPDLPKNVFVTSLIFLVGLGAAMTAHLITVSEAGRGELRVVDTLGVTEETGIPHASASTTNVGVYVGSRSGKTYHLPWCSGALRIKEENKIWFATKAEAEARGYKPAANCKGI
jgi:hypothetical protein